MGTRFVQIQAERDELYTKFTQAIQEVQQKSGFKNLLLERKLTALTDCLEKKEAQLNEVLSASNMDPMALGVVTRKLEVRLSVFCLFSTANFTSLKRRMLRCTEPSVLGSVWKKGQALSKGTRQVIGRTIYPSPTRRIT